MARNVCTRGSTNPALSMQDVLLKRKRYGSVLVITDEEENTYVYDNADGRLRQKQDFADIFARYEQTVAPGARATFVSFLRNLSQPGHMTPLLEAKGLPVRTFRMHQQRPDLRRLDAIFAAMEARSDEFAARVRTRAEQIAAQRGVQSLHLGDDSVGQATAATSQALRDGGAPAVADEQAHGLSDSWVAVDTDGMT